MSPSPDKAKKGKEKDTSRSRRVVLDSDSERKRSKFNLKLERVSSPGNKTLSAAGASLKWLFMRKKSKEINGSSSCVNPIPIVATAATASGSHVPGFMISPSADEMQEKIDPPTDDFLERSRSPSPIPIRYHPQHQHMVSVPRTLPQERISYGYTQNPQLQNFQLQGTAPPYPGKKLIFRPSPYAQGQPTHFSSSGSSRGSPPNSQMRGPYPPPPRMLRPQQQNFHNRSPPPRSPTIQQQPPRHFYNNYYSFPPSNFPNHGPNLARQPLSGNAFANHPNYHHYSHPNNHNSNANQPHPQVQYLQPPVPKQRKSLILRQSNATPYETSNFQQENNSGPPWIIVPNDHKLPRLPVPIDETHRRQTVIENMRHISNSCVNLSSSGNANSADEGLVVRKYSSQSRLSSCNSRSDFGSSSSIPWFRWFASRLEKEQKEGRTATKYAACIKAAEVNPKCIRCNKKFPSKGVQGVINAPVSCSVCKLKVCKNCALWDQSKNSYSCGHCHPPKSIDKTKNFWFDNISLSVGPGTNFAAAERDKVTEDVREHLERIIESQVDEGIDAVSLARLFDHPQYELVFHRFHQELSDSLVSLGFSLKLAIENKPMPMNETPTSAHTALTDLLTDIKEVAMELPLMAPMNKTEAAVALAQNDSKAVQPSYEDVLATAVINKAISHGQKLRRKADSPMSLVDSAVQTDSEMSENSEINSNKNQYKDVRGWVTNLEKTPPQQHPNLSDDDLSMGTSSSNWSNEGNIKGNQQVVIEEQVEEITTTYESDSDISRHPPSRNRKGRKTARQRNTEHSNSNNNNVVHDDTLLGVDLNHFDNRVPFPEGGVDIIPRSTLDEEQDEELDATGVLVSQISEWEQNWLFKRRKQLLRRRNLMAEAVPMLVPNPNDDGIEPFIGDDKASDLSDLSDHVNGNDDDDNSDFVLSGDSEPEVVKDEDNAALQKPTEVDQTVPMPTPRKLEPSSLIPQPISVSAADCRRPSNSSVSSRDSASLGHMSETETSRKRPSTISTSKSDVPKPKKPENRPIDNVKLVQEPSDIHLQTGQTARFACIVTEDSPEFSVAWFFDGHLMTTREGKSWVYSCGKDKHHYLYVYDCNEKDSGKYHVSLFDFKGNETKVSFKLHVEATRRGKAEPPNFTLLQDTVLSNKADPVVKIPFEVTGCPEPYLQVFRNDVEISKLSHVILEDKGDGQWNLDLHKKETNFPVYGEYVAVAKNSQGVTRVTFTVQETEGPSSGGVNLNKTMKQEALPRRQPAVANGHEKSPSPLPRPVSAASSETSSTGETMREQYHTLNRNQTMVREDYEADLNDSYHNVDPSKMTVAEREKLKWLNPVNLPNNPYAPENLAKRIRQRESGTFHMPASGSGDVTVTSSDDEKIPAMEHKQNMSQYSRDYYVSGATNQPPKLKSTSGPNFGSSRSLSLTSNSSREGSKEKDNAASLERKSSSVVTTPIVPSRSGQETRASHNGSATAVVSNGTRNDRPTFEGVKKLNVFEPRRTPSPQSPTSQTPSPRPRRHNSDLGSLNAHLSSVESKTVKLPSVRRLAQQFQASDDKVHLAELKPSNGHQQKVFQPREQKSYQQVHSLTARSVSRQFREGLKQAQPHTADINIKIPKEKQQNNNKQLKLSEFQENHNNDNFTSTTNGIKNGIMARAAFWDKRVQEGIIDDELVIKEFPKLEI